MSAFDRLHPGVRKWIWRQGWQGLRDVQEQAIPPISDGRQDVILAAATAAGKTEAAFLPILSNLAGQAGGSIRALCVSPLKALINDQHERLTGMAEGLDVPVHKWHGDVDGGRKQRLRNQPQGILLITPESLEATFVRRGFEVPGFFRHLAYVVVDELHAFLGPGHRFLPLSLPDPFHVNRLTTEFYFLLCFRSQIFVGIDIRVLIGEQASDIFAHRSFEVRLNPP